MTRDYAKSVQRGREKKTAPSTPGWVWALSGFLGGVVCSAAIFVALQEGGVAPPQQVRAIQPKSAPVAKPATEPAAEAKPKFDFYTILPQFEVVIPERDVEERPAPTATAKSKTPPSAGSYYLQAGSFRRFQQADAVKAKLALVGMSAGIETVTINDNETWHRVRLGPYHDLVELRRVRSQLEKSAISTILLREK
jgi:cell division protein FtsN